MHRGKYRRICSESLNVDEQLKIVLGVGGKGEAAIPKKDEAVKED